MKRLITTLLMVLTLNLGGCMNSHGVGAQVGKEERPLLFTVKVGLLPSGDVVDLTRTGLPPLPSATVKVWELGQQWQTDSAGKLILALPLGVSPGYSGGEGVYTFEVTHRSSNYRTIVRRRLTAQEESFEIHYNSHRDVFFDWSSQVPKRVDAKIMVLDLPIQSSATVFIEETGKQLPLDTPAGTSEVSLAEGFYTFSVSISDSPYKTRVRVGIFTGHPDVVVIHYRHGSDSYMEYPFDNGITG